MTYNNGKQDFHQIIYAVFLRPLQVIENKMNNYPSLFSLYKLYHHNDHYTQKKDPLLHFIIYQT